MMLKRTFLAAIATASLFLFNDATAQAAEKAKPYPLKKCVVSDEDLGSMGDPYVFTHKGQEVKLCCKGCLKDFNKNPDKFVKKMAAAEKKK
jgi:hypothetical protein